MEEDDEVGFTPVSDEYMESMEDESVCRFVYFPPYSEPIVLDATLGVRFKHNPPKCQCCWCYCYSEIHDTDMRKGTGMLFYCDRCAYAFKYLTDDDIKSILFLRQKRRDEQEEISKEEV